MGRNRDGRGFVYVVMVTTDATAFLAEIADDNTREFFLAPSARPTRCQPVRARPRVPGTVAVTGTPCR